MTQTTDPVFDLTVWGPALKKYGDVVQLSVALYGADEQMVCGPLPATPIATIFQAHGYDPGVRAECLRACLARTSDDRSPVVVSTASQLAVVGVPLQLDGRTVGAVVAGYSLVNFCDSAAIARLARASGTPFPALWAVARSLRPVPSRRLVQLGELLQVLVDTLLSENAHRRQAEHAARRFSHLAGHDSLTELPNRSLLFDRLTRALALAHRHGRRLALLFVDIDRFKHINDSLGHALGDGLLQLVAREISQCVRGADTVSRYGGDEFVVLVTELKRAEDAGEVALKIVAAVTRPQTLAGHDLRISVSLGISVFPDDAQDAETLLKHADLAMYHAKDQGRGGYQFFQPELNVRAVERQSIEAGLHHALDQREFTLLYQPKVNLKTGALAGAEALIRWQHPDRGLLAPAWFVPIAEDCGLIMAIGRWVVAEACRQARAWQDAGLPPTPVSVNISAVEFRAKSFLEHIVNILNETGLDPRWLEIELTESVLMGDVTAATAVIRALKALGVQLAIDDFGTGWSSLSYLRHLPVDAMKIDKSFVQEITTGSNAGPIVSAVINMAKSLKYRVIAEGVETVEQLAFLQAEDCGEGQGYYFSRPLIAQQFARVMERGTTRSGVQPFS
ncbi:MAG: EAL domain-containing protein [Acidobacteriota bacterium]